MCGQICSPGVLLRVPASTLRDAIMCSFLTITVLSGTMMSLGLENKLGQSVLFGDG